MQNLKSALTRLKPIYGIGAQLNKKRKRGRKMGNRAVLTNKNKKIGLYLHWNGGPESITAFLTYAKLCGVRGANYDENYCFARLSQIIGNFIGGTLSIGVGVVDCMDIDNGDNGLYVIGDNWDIVERTYDTKAMHTKEEMLDFLREINNRQPAQCKLDDEKLKNAEFVKVPGFVFKQPKKYVLRAFTKSGSPVYFMNVIMITDDKESAEKFDTIEAATKEIQHFKNLFHYEEITPEIVTE